MDWVYAPHNDLPYILSGQKQNLIDRVQKAGESILQKWDILETLHVAGIAS